MGKSAKVILILAAWLVGCGCSNAQQSDKQPASSPSAMPAGEDNSVGSFFQLPSTQTVAETKPSDRKSKVGKAPHAGYRLIWHALDNLGVPMFFGLDSDLDPSLRRADIVPPPKSTTKGDQNLPRIQIPTPPSSSSSSEAPPEKIPESELEGTQYEKPAIQDEQKQTP